MASNQSDRLLAAALEGDRIAVARLLSLIERGDDAARKIGRLAYPLSGHAYTVGITGAPGAGKSTLTSALIGHLRADGLALATPEAVRLLDAVGRRLVLIETVGVGQVEVEVAGKADTTVVVVNPGWGDSVQANKAGLLEIADVFVINKSDRKGADETRRDLEQMLDLSQLSAGWRPPIIDTVATDATGVAALWDAVLAHRAFAESGGQLAQRRSARAADELREIVAQRLRQR